MNLNITSFGFVLLMLFSLACGSGGSAVDNLFGTSEGATDEDGAEKDPEYIEVPVANDLSLEITNPSEDGVSIGYERKVGGNCGTVGKPIKISGDATGYAVCNADSTWETTVNFNGSPVGTVTIQAKMVDEENEIEGEAVSRSFNRVSAVCDTPEARAATFANIAPYGTGDGVATPYYICTSVQLQNITANNTANIELHNDIDMANTLFTPIASTAAEYTGVFNGNNFTISNFVISNTGSSIGLFRESKGATFKNLKIDNARVTGNYYVGVLVGYVELGTNVFENIHISNSYIETLHATNGYAGAILGASRNGAGSIEAKDSTVTDIEINSKNYVGGMFGYVNSLTTVTLENLHVYGGEIVGAQSVGGIVGQNISTGMTFTNGSSSASVTGSNGNIGGIAGYTRGVSFEDLRSSGNVVRTGGNNVGGIIGYLYTGTLSGSKAAATRPSGQAPPSDTCYASGKVQGGAADNVGGIVGYTRSSAGDITSCYYNGQSVDGGTDVGGLIGENHSDNITDSFVSSTATISGVSTRIGGLIGYVHTDSQTLSESYSDAKVTASGVTVTYVGGLIGRFQAGTEAVDCSATGDVEVLNGDGTGAIQFVGGLMGAADNNNRNIINCSAEGDVTVVTSATGGFAMDQVGGLVGYSRMNISDSIASGSVRFELGSSVGGLVGYILDRDISDSRWTGAEVKGAYNVGGLVGNVGNTNTEIYRSGASGEITALSTGTNTASNIGAFAGGLVGFNRGDIFDSWASGAVQADGDYVGGLEGGANTGGTNRNISGSFSSGSVDAGSGKSVGGISGRISVNTNNFVDNFSASTVRGSDEVGGLIGHLYRDANNGVRRNYFTGQVTKAAGGAGTAVGYLWGTIEGSTAVVVDLENYYNSSFLPYDEDTGADFISPYSFRSYGLTPAQMLTSTNFNNFDFLTTPVWGYKSNFKLPGKSSNFKYPILEWMKSYDF